MVEVGILKASKRQENAEIAPVAFISGQLYIKMVEVCGSRCNRVVLRHKDCYFQMCFLPLEV